jgi:hypothetical protein
MRNLLSGAQSQMQAQARLVALFDARGEDIERQLSSLLESGWHSWSSPPGFEVVQLDQPLGESDALSKLVADVQAKLKAAEIEPAAVTGHLVSPGGDVDSSGGYAVNLLSSPDFGEISDVFRAAVSSVSSSRASPDGGPPPEPPDTGKEAGKSTTRDEFPKASGTSPTLADPAATIAATIPAFPDAQPLWDYVEEAARSELARGIVSSTYTARTELARRSEWVVAPEMVLLDASPQAQREDLAMNMLKVRAGLTKADDDTRTAKATAAEKEAALAGERVAFAQQGVALARETLEHMKKWRSIANIGLWVLAFTTAFSMAAAGYLLLYLAPHNDVSDAAIPVIIFVLALFAISPAVLLLRERPLEGLDKWSPPGASSDSKGGATAMASPKASSSTAKPVVAAGPAK